VRLILRMTIAFVSSNLIRAAIAFATAVVIGRELGAAEFGRWTFCMAWAATLTTFFDLGFGILLTRDAARAQAGVGTAVSHALLARLGLLAPVGVVFCLAAAPLGAAVDSQAGMRIVVVLAGAGAAYGCLSAVFRAWPEWLVPILAVEAAGALLQLFGTWWIARHAGGFVGLLWLATVVQAAQILAAALLWRLAPDRHDGLVMPGVRGAIALVRRALPFALTGIIANAQQRLAPLALGYLGAAEQVALFGAAQRFANLVKIFPQSVFAGALPVLSRELRTDRGARMRLQFDRAMTVFAIVSATGLGAFAPLIIRIVYGRSFQGAGIVLVWTAIGLVPTLVNSARKLCLYAAGRERLATFWSAVALAAQGLGCAVLIQTFGAAGAAVAVAAGEALVWWPLRRTDGAVQPLELIGRPVGVMTEGPVAS
jgi:O-antigen/teichoic acid export membrane protein